MTIGITVPGSAQRQAWFAAARIDGKDTKAAKRAVTEEMMKATGLSSMSYEIIWKEEGEELSRHRNKITETMIKIHSVTKMIFKRRHQILPAHWFKLHKATGEFDWKRIYQSAALVVDYYKARRREERQADTLQKMAAMRKEILEKEFSYAKGLGIENGQLVLRISINDEIEGRQILTALQNIRAVNDTKQP